LQSGGLWQEALDLYGPFGIKAKQHPNLVITFPSGAQIQFKVCQTDADTKNFDGGQYSFVCFDEAQWHSQKQVSYLESRIRSKAKGPHRLVCTCNPLRDSFLLKFVEYYLDKDTGIPIPELSGKERYYAQYNGDYVFGDTAKDITDKYGPNCKPQTYTFISATIYSNPVMIKRNPEYLDRLENLDRVERERLLLGSWYAREANSSYFQRQWCEIVPYAPVNVVARVRAWDFAASVPSESNKDPDYTAGIKLSRDKFGTYYVEDAYRFRKLTDGVLKEVIDTAKRDGIDECTVGIVKDTGAGGAASNMFFVRQLAEHGIAARSTKMSGHSGKIQRFLPFAAMAEAGAVKIVRGPWNDEFFNELESFTGGRSGHDDQVDATSDAFNMIAKSIQIPTFTIPNYTQQSIVSKINS